MQNDVLKCIKSTAGQYKIERIRLKITESFSPIFGKPPVRRVIACKKGNNDLKD